MTEYLIIFIFVGIFAFIPTVSAENNLDTIDKNVINEANENLIDIQISSASANRNIQTQNLAAGSSTNITVTITNNLNQSLSLKESLPPGWNLARISDEASSFKANTNEWTWFAFGAGVTQNVTYKLGIPSNASAGTYYINGSISNSSGVIADVTGENLITVTSQLAQVSASANRDIQTQNLAAGSSTNITVTITNNLNQSLSLKESLPLGWNLARISDEASSFKANTNEWTWFAFGAGVTQNVTYKLSIPSNASSGTYYINGSISNSSGVIANVTGMSIINIITVRRTNLTNISVLTNTTNTADATYILMLANNGTNSDSYTLMVENPNGASTAALNITSPLTLNAGQTSIFLLSVNHNISGTFHVNVTARSANDTTWYGYINTTTTVNRTIVDKRIGTIINQTTFITNATLEIIAPSGNVTIIIPNGTNASVGGAALTSISIDSRAQVNSSFILGSFEKLIGENVYIGPEGARFSPDIQIRFNYTDAQLAAAGVGESDLIVKYYNISAITWENLAIFERNTTGNYLIVNTSHFSTFALVGTVSPLITTTPNSGGSSGSSSSGGGGGGGSSGESYSNILLIEKYDLQISKDVLTSYKFTDQKNPIMFVNITGNTSYGIITTSVEVLKNTSTLVKTKPEGVVYKNVNIWAGTSGFATPRNIKEASIMFKVDNPWISINSLTSSDIILLRWDGSKWITLDTKVKEKDGANTYFEAKTTGFSEFAITAKKTQGGPASGGPPIQGMKEVARISEEVPNTTTTPEQKAQGFEIVAVIAVLWSLYLFQRKRR